MRRLESQIWSCLLYYTLSLKSARAACWTEAVNLTGRDSDMSAVHRACGHQPRPKAEHCVASVLYSVLARTVQFEMFGRKQRGQEWDSVLYLDFRQDMGGQANRMDYLDRCPPPADKVSNMAGVEQ